MPSITRRHTHTHTHTHGQNDVQTLLRGTLYPMLYAPDTITILHLNTNNAFFSFLFCFSHISFSFIFFILARVFDSPSRVHTEARARARRHVTGYRVAIKYMYVITLDDNAAAILESP